MPPIRGKGKKRVRSPEWHHSWRTAANAWDYIKRFIRLRYEGTFTVDVAATSENTLCRNFFTREDNALNHPWATSNPVNPWEWAICNPPYDNIDAFCAKAYTQSRHGVNSVLLIPAFDGTIRWRKWIYGKADLVINLIGRLRFGDPETGEEGDQAKFASCFVVYEGKQEDSEYIVSTQTLIAEP